MCENLFQGILSGQSDEFSTEKIIKLLSLDDLARLKDQILFGHDFSCKKYSKTYCNSDVYLNLYEEVCKRYYSLLIDKNREFFTAIFDGLKYKIVDREKIDELTLIKCDNFFNYNDIRDALINAVFESGEWNVFSKCKGVVYAKHEIFLSTEREILLEELISENILPKCYGK